MEKLLDVEIERGDLCYGIFAPVTHPETKERFIEVCATWDEGEDGVLCRVHDVAESADFWMLDMANDYEIFEKYPEAKAEAEAKGEFDDDWVLEYFVKIVNDTADVDPWDNTEIGGILADCYRIGKLREAGIPLDIRAELDEASGAVKISYEGKAVSMTYEEFAKKAMKAYLPQESLWRIAKE